jgi:hypothetical protein
MGFENKAFSCVFFDSDSMSISSSGISRVSRYLFINGASLISE